ncbi:gliding motility-associated C-terminal domain-containing protein [Mucilaginibacter kameinonensis]|uniref:gliding motility-associated C-terminal domain-containing protein n=1 Tax=Mucilaginibacter kameinonensis TaxID=452286 RepID=UPI000EF82C80|nr:gliding motility-associated C-terminal domain-containing protein [Mucilaginibacter kameinonensis]
MKFITLLAIVCLSPQFALRLKAQEGEPVLIEDFGAGSAQIGPKINDGNFSTTYNYIPSQPGEGSYTIANSTTGMYPESWLQTGNHTPGQPNGYMMIVDATNTIDEFYKRTVKTLCPGTTYRFSVYVLNLMQTGGIKPDITFSVTTSLETKTNHTGPIDNGLGWLEYNITFNTPPTGGDVTIKMTNNASGGYGNDVALDDISLRPYGPALATYFGNDKTATTAQGCADADKVYTLNVSAASDLPYTNPVYQWQISTPNGWINIPGALSASYTLHQPTATGNYQYRALVAQQGNINSAQCRLISSAISLTIINPEPVTATASSPVCPGENIYLTASTGDSYSWTGPNGFTSVQQNPVINGATAAMSGQYHVTVFKNGCSSVAPAVTVNINSPVIASAGDNKAICKGEKIQLHASGGTSYKWYPATGLSNPNIADPLASPDETTTYTVEVTNNNCKAKSAVTLTVNQGPGAFATATREVIKGDRIQLHAQVSGENVSYYWTPNENISNTTSLEPFVFPTSSITYILHVLQPGSCNLESKAAVEVKVIDKFTIPNTFTPNGDGINDTWQIDALGAYDNAITQVFNRYGTIVYNAKGYTKPWDGTYNGNRLPPGTYYYKIDLKNGTVYSGWVQIIG